MAEETDQKAPPAHDVACYDEIIEREIESITVRYKTMMSLQKKLIEQQNDFYKDKALMSKDTLVYLNVGGVQYTTFQGNLVKYPKSRLAVLFSGRYKLACDENENVFLDRDGKTFRHLLNFLRNDEVDLPSDEEEKYLLKLEFSYFGLPFGEDLKKSSETLPRKRTIGGHAPPLFDDNIYVLLREKEQLLAKEEEKLQRLQEHEFENSKIVQEQHDLATDILRLNVGGTVVETSRRTLCVDKGSRLYDMFKQDSKHFWVRDKKRNIFLDYDAWNFRVLLFYLRNMAVGREMTLPERYEPVLKHFAIGEKYQQEKRPWVGKILCWRCGRRLEYMVYYMNKRDVSRNDTFRVQSHSACCLECENIFSTGVKDGTLIRLGVFQANK